mmetsp:Transcript_24017/g.51062  ORF Transcript_24017/g.51062 Transcript_24017/m.51062 type:complete len:95 (-) Transcript_24017:204-488(-)
MVPLGSKQGLNGTKVSENETLARVRKTGAPILVWFHAVPPAKQWSASQKSLSPLGKITKELWEENGQLFGFVDDMEVSFGQIHDNKDFHDFVSF